MRWDIDNRIYKQPVILIKKDGDQSADEMNCCAVKFGNEKFLQYPRTLIRDGIKYGLLKYSEHKNIVFYKIKRRQ